MMFGGLQLPAKPDLKPRPVPKIVDVTGINVVAHVRLTYKINYI